MSFLFPLGLLGLVGIPIVIIIYIIKNKYTEQTIASTYIWTLSEQFAKRRRRRNPLEGLIPLILQVLTILFITLAIAHPIIKIPNGANEYTFVVDASGSMSIEKDGETRLQRGLDEIEKIIEESKKGSTYSIVQVGDTTSIVCERVDDKDVALELLKGITPSHKEGDKIDAVRIAQGYFNDNRGTKTYFVTDTDYESVKNIEVINTALDEVNYSIDNIEYQFTASELLVSGEAFIYGKDSAEIVIQLIVDDREPIEQRVTVKKGEPVTFSFNSTATYFESLTVKIKDEDALALDNTYIAYDVKSTSIYNVLVVSDRPFFIEAVIKNLGFRNVAVLNSKQYKGQTGFGLYVFDSLELDSVPTDGTVWLINPVKAPDNTGFGIKDTVTLAEGEEGKLQLSDSSSSVVEKLSKDVKCNEIYISKYLECGLYRSFSNVLTYNQVPLLFAGQTTSGNREVVFAFDIHDSNITMTTDYVILMSNLLNYSFPDIVDQVNYTVGDEAEINVPAGTESIKVESPKGNTIYLNTSSAVASFEVTEVGTYKVILDSSSEIKLYSSLSENESEVKPTATGLELQGEADNKGLDGIYDTLMVIFIILAVIFSADWMVYCYEKYQLR